MEQVNANPEMEAANEIPEDDTAARFAKMIGGDSPNDKPSEAEPSQPEEGESEEQKERLYKVKVDGQEIEVPESELLKGYSRTADYTNKTKALAEERRALQSHAEQVQRERQDYIQATQYYLQNVPQTAPPDPSLIENDPVEYLRQQRAFETAIAQRHAAAQQLSYAQQQQAMEQEQSLQAFVQQQAESLPTYIPEWKDTKTATEDKAAIRAALKSVGFDDKEIGGVIDARMVAVARKAMLYDRLTSQAQTAAKKVENVPKFEKPGTRPAPSASDGRTSAMQALKKSGTTADAAAVFERMF